jgi:hypothetical protein
MDKPTIFEEASGLPLLPFNEANERLATLTRTLERLVEQITKGSWVDDHGHEFARNVAYLDAVQVLEDGKHGQG